MHKNIIFDLHGVLFNTAAPGGEKRFLPIEEGERFLRECKAGGTLGKIVACTNWSNEKVAILKEEYPEIMNLFDDVVTPSAAQARKPDPAMFNYIFDLHGIVAHDTLFIDDTFDNILGGRAVGLHSFHIVDSESFNDVRKEIKNSAKLS